ncbi:hypothetical protein ALC57_16761 [Trachymyrmex cornetzi]|uniref:Uncharacterized protein n=1 Tax=Trachymyrmex cornetzi TaxID=471704 RepID=A0A151IUN8_9HYME|nr:hypothetical protein ALC57_16761 [Trachymyrmex cornetzi]
MKLRGILILVQISLKQNSLNNINEQWLINLSDTEVPDKAKVLLQLGHQFNLPNNMVNKDKNFTYKKLYISDGVLYRCYGLPKIHKEGHPLRMIVSCINNPFYPLANFLKNMIEDIVIFILSFVGASCSDTLPSGHSQILPKARRLLRKDTDHVAGWLMAPTCATMVFIKRSHCFSLASSRARRNFQRNSSAESSTVCVNKAKFVTVKEVKIANVTSFFQQAIVCHPNLEAIDAKDPGLFVPNLDGEERRQTRAGRYLWLPDDRM